MVGAELFLLYEVCCPVEVRWIAALAVSSTVIKSNYRVPTPNKILSSQIRTEMVVQSPTSRLNPRSTSRVQYNSKLVSRYHYHYNPTNHQLRDIISQSIHLIVHERSHFPPLQ